MRTHRLKFLGLFFLQPWGYILFSPHAASSSSLTWTSAAAGILKDGEVGEERSSGRTQADREERGGSPVDLRKLLIRHRFRPKFVGEMDEEEGPFSDLWGAPTLHPQMCNSFGVHRILIGAFRSSGRRRVRLTVQAGADKLGPTASEGKLPCSLSSPPPPSFSLPLHTSQVGARFSGPRSSSHNAHIRSYTRARKRAPPPQRHQLLRRRRWRTP